MSSIHLVTGGLGFIGSHLVSQLREQGKHVRVLDVDVPPEPGAEDVEYVTGSILNPDVVRKALDGVNCLYHLAANPNLWSPDKNSFFEVNHHGTRRVLEEAERAGVEKVVYCSTGALLKNVQDEGGQTIVDDSVKLQLDDMPGPYCRSKFLAEREAFRAAGRGLPLVIVNPTMPVGPGDHNLTPPTKMILGFLNGEYQAYLESRLNLIDVRDVARGHILAAEKGTPAERYILGAENTHLSDLLDELEDVSGRPMPDVSVPYWLALAGSEVQEFVSDHLTHNPPSVPLSGVRLARSSVKLDCGKARDELGLKCRPLHESLIDAVQWYRENGMLKERSPGK